MTIGQRNNNPLNIRRVPGQKWKGEASPQPSPVGEGARPKVAAAMEHSPKVAAAMSPPLWGRSGEGLQGPSSASFPFPMASAQLFASSAPTGTNTKPYASKTSSPDGHRPPKTTPASTSQMSASSQASEEKKGSQKTTGRGSWGLWQGWKAA